nr:immunoglobulin heavy chain junction region [Macaca mulatta]
CARDSAVGGTPPKSFEFW